MHGNRHFGITSDSLQEKMTGSCVYIHGKYDLKQQFSITIRYFTCIFYAIHYIGILFVSYEMHID